MAFAILRLSCSYWGRSSCVKVLATIVLVWSIAGRIIFLGRLQFRIKEVIRQRILIDCLYMMTPAVAAT